VKKTIEFSAKLSTTDFDQQISKLQNRLKSSQTDISRSALTSEVQQRMSRAGLATGVPPQQAEAQQKQSLRDLDRFIKTQYQQAQQLNKAIDERAKKIADLRKQETASLNDEKAKLEIGRQINALNGQRMSLERQHSQQMGSINQSLSQRGGLASGMAGAPQGMERLGRAYAGGGLMGAGRAGYRMMGGGMGVGLAGLGMLGAGIQLADPLIRSMAAENRNYTYAQGSVVSGAPGAGDVYGNKMATSMFFAPERQRALDTALSKMKGTQFADKYTMGVGGLMGKVTAGAASGAGMGAMLAGIPTLGVGAGPGAMLGAGMGAIGGLGKGVYDIASDQRTRLAFMSNLGSKDAKKKLEAMQYSEMVTDFNSLVEAEKSKDPIRKMAEEKFQLTRERNLGAQRSMGLSNAGFYGGPGGGGFLGRGFAAGFTEEETLGTSQGILGAGGSTRAATKSNVLANQMVKRMDMTNAASIVGGLSGQMGTATATESATIKLLSEGMKLGLDKSEFAAEQRKYADLTLSAIQASGASTVAGAAQAAAGLSGFYGGSQTMQGLQAMKGAAGFYDQATKQTGGPSGAMFAAKLLSDPELSGLSYDTMSALSQLPAGRLTADNPAVQQAAAESGMTTADIVKKMQGGKSSSFIVRSTTEKTRAGLSDRYAKMKSEGKMSEEEMISNLSGGKEGLTALITGISAERGSFSELSNEEQKSMAMKMVRGEISGEGLEAAAQAKLAETKPTGRVEDVSNEAIAVQQKIVNDQFIDMKDAMGQAAEAAKTMTAEALRMHMALAKAISEGKPMTPEEWKRTLTPEQTKPGTKGSTGNW
jgi:hypothetical protein